MTLEFICSEKIENKLIEIPQNSNFYRLKSGKIKFFKVNPHSEGLKPIPQNARYVEFFIEINEFHIDYGKPRFYDSNRNVLK